MILLEALPWLASFVMLGLMAALARSAFSAGEFAGRARIEPPSPPSPDASDAPGEEPSGS